MVVGRVVWIVVLEVVCSLGMALSSTLSSSASSRKCSSDLSLHMKWRDPGRFWPCAKKGGGRDQTRLTSREAERRRMREREMRKHAIEMVTQSYFVDGLF